MMADRLKGILLSAPSEEQLVITADFSLYGTFPSTYLITYNKIARSPLSAFCVYTC